MDDGDEKIVKKILDGEGALFEEIIRRYKNPIYALCFRMVGNAEDAKDLAQETFIKVYNGLEKYNPAYRFSTWIFKIASNLCVDILRKKRIQVCPLDDQIKYDTVSAEDIYFHHRKRQEIDGVIQGLSDEYRMVILLYHKEGLSYDEICKILNLPMSKVKNRLHRARKILKERLKEIREEESGWTAPRQQI